MLQNSKLQKFFTHNTFLLEAMNAILLIVIGLWLVLFGRHLESIGYSPQFNHLHIGGIALVVGVIALYHATRGGNTKVKRFVIIGTFFLWGVIDSFFAIGELTRFSTATPIYFVILLMSGYIYLCLNYRAMEREIDSRNDKNLTE